MFSVKVDVLVEVPKKLIAQILLEGNIYGLPCSDGMVRVPVVAVRDRSGTVVLH